jgi:excisionase family DNA binding protein
MTISTDHELLTVAEAAERLRVTTRFIRMLIAEGRLPAMRLGRRSIRLRRDDVDDLLRPIERWVAG